MDNQTEKLERRIAELEKQLASFANQQKPQIEEKDMETFKKVGAQLGYQFIDECGINECKVLFPRFPRPRFPYPFPIPKPCIFECSCGPCNIYDFRELDAMDRFRSMGY